MPEEVKKTRADEVGALFRKVANELHQKHVGEIQLVLVDGASRRSDDFLKSRNDGNVQVIIPRKEIPDSLGSKNKRPIQDGDYIAVMVCVNRIVYCSLKCTSEAMSKNFFNFFR